jgi:D-glucosaminate-6-phosphate ammonia-lyase
MDVYERLGVRTIINARGPVTRLGGGILRTEVAEAMVEASQTCVDMAELQARASAMIAEITGAEAGYVTSGAACALVLGAAACVAGLDPAAMDRLPHTDGGRDEIVMIRSQRNAYDHAIRTVGVTLIEVGLPDRFAGAGVRDAEAWEIAAAITERTAAVFYVATPDAVPPLAEVVAVAHSAKVPILVDAAAQLPPAANLRAFIAEGADLVAFSGGKEIGGPQASGFLCGRKDLIMSAALQHLDLDIVFADWHPPATLIDKACLPGAPHHGIGRPCKVGKEEVVGLLTALQLFVAESDGTRMGRNLDRAERLAAALNGIPGARPRLLGSGDTDCMPTVELVIDVDTGVTAPDLVRRLEGWTPAIYAAAAGLDTVQFVPSCLRLDQIDIIRGAVASALAAYRPPETSMKLPVT